MSLALNFNLHSKQGSALLSKATEILYGGAAGGGKSHLMRVMAVLLCTMVPNLQVYIFRKHFGDLYKNHMEGPSGFPLLLWPWLNAGLCKINIGKNYIEFWNGAKIHLCHLQHEKDLLKYQGAEIHVLLMDELTHFTEKEYRFLRGRVRAIGLVIPHKELAPGLLLSEKLPLVLCGSNPGSKGHVWVKRAFVDYAPPLQVNKTRKIDGGMLRAYIPARLMDNPTLMDNDPDYLERLEGLGDPALIKAMRDGDWNIVAGGAFDDVWEEEHLVLPRFPIPYGWRIDRSFDWGSSHPASVGWWAESNGEDVTYIQRELENGRLIEYEVTRNFPRGSYIRIAEWYMTKELGTNEGLKLSPKEIAEGIKQREASMRSQGWIAGTVLPGPADGQIYQTTRSDIPSIGDTMGEQGVYWIPADKSKGSRVNGFELVRGRMKEREGPGIFFMNNCRAAISLLPILPRDPDNTEDVDTDAEDHLFDDVRYKVLGPKPLASKLKVRHANER
jgi:hypothetical protein